MHHPQHFVQSPISLQHHSKQVLAEGVQRISGNMNSVHIACFCPLQHHGALHQLLSVQNDYPALYSLIQAVAPSAEALQKRGDGLGRADLQDEIDVGHVDAQLQGGGGADDLEEPLLETALRVQPSLPAHGAVVAGGVLGIVELRKALLEVEEHPLCSIPAVGEDEGAPVLLDMAVEQLVEPDRPALFGRQG